MMLVGEPPDRVRLRSADYYFLTMMLACTALVALSWDRYDSCKDPIAPFLLVSYLALAVFRLLHFLGQKLRSRRHRLPCLEVACLFASLCAVYPFLWAWLITGTVWFQRSNSCLSSRAQWWSALAWICFLYLYLVVYGIVVAISLHQVILLARRQREGLLPLYMPIQAGLTRTEISALPTKTHTPTPPGDSSTCSICLDDVPSGSKIRSLRCQHVFHLACLDTWLERRNTCPNCKRQIVSDQDQLVIQPAGVPNGSGSGSGSGSAGGTGGGDGATAIVDITYVPPGTDVFDSTMRRM